MAQVIRPPKLYDVCIIGSGAAGGTAAKILAEGGLNVVMLEAGPPLDPARDYKEHFWPYDLEHRGAGVGGKLRGLLNTEFLAPNGAWEIDGEPYFRTRFYFPLVSLANCWWPHQSLGPDRVASCARGFQIAIHRRHG